MRSAGPESERENKEGMTRTEVELDTNVERESRLLTKVRELKYEQTEGRKCEKRRRFRT